MITKQPPFTPTLGAIHSDSETTFRIWALAQDAVRVVFDDDGEEHPMQVDAAGFFSCARSRRSHRPSLLPPPAGRRPDPASCYQPDGPLGPSEVVSSHRFAWSDDDWSGAPPAPQRRLRTTYRVRSRRRAHGELPHNISPRLRAWRDHDRSDADCGLLRRVGL